MRNRAEGRLQQLKNDASFAAAAIALPGLLLAGQLSKTEISVDSDTPTPTRLRLFNRGIFNRKLASEGRFKTFVPDGGTAAGMIGEEAYIVYDLENGKTHDGRARIRFGGKIKERIKNGRTVFSMRGGKTRFLEDGEVFTHKGATFEYDKTKPTGTDTSDSEKLTPVAA